MNKFIGIIPARYGSSRFPGKPLVDILGKPMIQWVYERSKPELDDLYIATDDERIAKAVEKFGGKYILTDKDHINGTTRVWEASSKIKAESNDIIINIQGDEPLIDTDHIKKLKECFNDGVKMATLITPATNKEELNNESEVFVVFDKNFDALYFSRQVIPYLKGITRDKWFENYKFYKHIGIYAYTKRALNEFVKFSPTILENVESLEQNRWIENGEKIRVSITESVNLPVDTPEDLKTLLNYLKEKNYK